VRCGPHVFNFKPPIRVIKYFMLTRHLITNFEFVVICQFDGSLGYACQACQRLESMAVMNNALQSEVLVAEVNE
jgi:hypothetical protein